MLWGCVHFHSLISASHIMHLPVNRRDVLVKGDGRWGWWMVVRRAKPPWKELALRPPGPRVVLAGKPAEWALSQTSVCSLLLELLAGWVGWCCIGGGEEGTGAFSHNQHQLLTQDTSAAQHCRRWKFGITLILFLTQLLDAELHT